MIVRDVISDVYCLREQRLFRMAACLCQLVNFFGSLHMQNGAPGCVDFVTYVHVKNGSRSAVLNLWVATPAGVALGFPRGRLEPHEFVKK